MGGLNLAALGIGCHTDKDSCHNGGQRKVLDAKPHSFGEEEVLGGEKLTPTPTLQKNIKIYWYAMDHGFAWVQGSPPGAYVSPNILQYCKGRARRFLDAVCKSLPFGLQYCTPSGCNIAT